MQRFDVRDSVFKCPKNYRTNASEYWIGRYGRGVLGFARGAVGVGSGVAASKIMKLLGFLLMLAGWLIVLAAVAMLAGAGARGVFVTAGVGVEVMGLVLVTRAHPSPKGFED